MKKVVILIVLVSLCMLISCNAIIYSCDIPDKEPCADGNPMEVCVSRFSDSGWIKVNGQKLEFESEMEAGAQLIIGSAQCVGFGDKNSECCTAVEDGWLD